MRRNSKVSKRKIVIKPAEKRRKIQKIENPLDGRNGYHYENRKPHDDARKRIKIDRANRTQHNKPVDWKTIKFTSVKPIWKGETAFIVAGGPSLERFDFNQLKDKNTIVINKAFFHCPHADVMYWTDGRFYIWYKSDIDNFRGDKYTIKPHGNIRKDVKVLKNTGRSGLETENTGIRHGMNSGYAALNLAYHLGVKRMVLLGFDMTHNGKRSHFHDGYPTKATKTETLQKTFAPEFTQLAEEFKKKDIDVLNASSISRLTCFRKVDIKTALKF